jgi:hypothetical protein
MPERNEEARVLRQGGNFSGSAPQLRSIVVKSSLTPQKNYI